MDKLLTEYKIFLQESKVSDLSIKNYLVDARNFLGWFSLYLKTNKNLYSTSDSLMFSYLDSEIITKYRNFLSENGTPDKTVNRRLSGVRKLASFALSQGWILSNPAKMVQNLGSQNKKILIDRWKQELIQSYSHHLQKQNLNKTTIKNYVSDAAGFLSFLNQVI
ncbi:phage integrase SAM-like domain-containing protein [Candidatus Gottesmanbacteria bacterium]|nr:phage integrase SAM-like domain-containing protein [Candidatus Gottesmanbacteria bacterium]